MTNEPRFDPMKEIQNMGEQLTKEIEKRIRTITSSQDGLLLDMYESDGDLHIISQPVDGMIKDSIEISLESNILTISVETEAEATPTSARYLLQERRFGPLSRSVELSIPVKGQEARAKVDGGNRLLITLPIDDSVYGNITVTPVE
ncbi:MAG: Hsp20/alpha crystallin family protein [Chloroflexi bacterium]|nr:Hsp20/alpha crystallin family protein [Chloroflexota bacterium]